MLYDLYSNDESDQWRYLLGRAGRRTLVTVGLNPSTATQERSDPTVARVDEVARRNGFDGFVMANLYPVRATDYRTLPAKVNRVAFDRNLAAIEEVVAAQAEPVIWAAWGAPVVHHAYFLRARDELQRRLARFEPRWLRFGELTATGHPRHASRLDYDWSFAPYDFED
ncbi:hypothetical protein CKY39_27150 [Variovorax boronicumulans]|uniref:DUF1643 domain-containing protein n=1 Tax=Variovorax boronicumulans TaxID=436515 RepID=A0A250DQ55_9BURK|nr:DUF1643 domain-containing protein [Variovorax boronicumulans]ATA56505.1 hypothetical protein CKY39_27150 [Variovorax boronicumulans]